VVDGTQIDDRLHIAPSALNFQQLLVTGGDVLRRQVWVAAAQEELAVQALLGLDGGLVDPQQPLRGGAQEAVQAGLGRQAASQFGACERPQLVGVRDLLVESGDEFGADRGISLGLVGVVGFAGLEVGGGRIPLNRLMRTVHCGRHADRPRVLALVTGVVRDMSHD
jgi:hypothetical protein